MLNSAFLSKCLAVMLTHTCIQTYILKKPKFILKCGFVDLIFRVIQKFLFGHVIALHINGKRCSQEGSCPNYFQSRVVYAHHVISVSLQRFV